MHLDIFDKFKHILKSKNVFLLTNVSKDIVHE